MIIEPDLLYSALRVSLKGRDSVVPTGNPRKDRFGLGTLVAWCCFIVATDNQIAATVYLVTYPRMERANATAQILLGLLIHLLLTCTVDLPYIK